MITDKLKSLVTISKNLLEDLFERILLVIDEQISALKAVNDFN